MSNQKLPTRLAQLPTPRRRPSLSSKLDLDSAFFWLLLVFLITAFSFLSFRDRHVSLNMAQVAEYERRSQFLSNSTVYIVEVGRPESLLTHLSPSDWARVSVDIDYVAYVWDDLPVFLSDEWITTAENALKGNRIQIALFSCGCILPNIYFEIVKHRLAGFECLLLPGWVFQQEDIHWLQVSEGSDSCIRRQNILQARLVRRFRNELTDIGRVVNQINHAVDAESRPQAKSLPRTVEHIVEHIVNRR